MKYRVFYARDSKTRDLRWGAEHCKEQGCMPAPDSLDETHCEVDRGNAFTKDGNDQTILEAIFAQTNAPYFHPFPRMMRRILKYRPPHPDPVCHTAMSVGDVVILISGNTQKYYLCDGMGWYLITTSTLERKAA